MDGDHREPERWVGCVGRNPVLLHFQTLSEQGGYTLKYLHNLRCPDCSTAGGRVTLTTALVRARRGFHQHRTEPASVRLHGGPCVSIETTRRPVVYCTKRPADDSQRRLRTAPACKLAAEATTRRIVHERNTAEDDRTTFAQPVENTGAFPQFCLYTQRRRRQCCA